MKRAGLNHSKTIVSILKNIIHWTEQVHGKNAHEIFINSSTTFGQARKSFKI